VAQTPGVTYLRADSVKICRLLRWSGPDETPLTFANHFKGIPYVAHTLEVNDGEELIVNTRQMDCTTFVETVTALTICAHQGKHSWQDYVSTLRTLRYRNGIIDGYPSRLHYFSEWIQDNEQKFLVREVQQPNPPFKAVQHVRVNYMSTHPQAYKALKAHPELIPAIEEQEQMLTGITRSYIPKEALRADSRLLRETVRDGDIIAITCNKKGLDIAHLGFAVWRKDGLHLLNASQLHKRVVTEPMTLWRYLQKHPSHTGIRIVRIVQ
jgi:hypothetical protein